MNPSSIKANPVQINKSLSINHEHNTCSYPLRSTVHRTEALRVTVNETNFTKTQWHPCVYPEILAILFYAIIISNMFTDTNSETIKLYQHANRPYSHYTKEALTPSIDVSNVSHTFLSLTLYTHTLSHTLSHTHSLTLVCYARLHNNIILIHSILKGYSPLKWLCKKYNCHCCHCIDDYETGDDGMYNVCV